MVIITQLSPGSSPTSTYRYDVFLSFRGTDTRYSFTDHLYKALMDADINTFLDDEEIQTGEVLKPELESAIKESKASIIVLSQNYASSTWCLDELVLILDQRRAFNHIVIPIFYHVEPTNVRKQQSSLEDAMTKHKHRMEVEIDDEKKIEWARRMELWKKALTEVADLKGKDANGRKETEFIEEIVTEIHNRLGPKLSTLPLPIGIDDSIECVTSWLKDGSLHMADILTVLGMGGIGKTTLAKYVYGLHCREFNKSSFIEDIGRRCLEKFNGLLDLQKQLYGDISKSSFIQVHDVSIYTSKIENALARKKVFLVLDGIDSLEQLDALLGNKGFHPGSKIMITTRDSSLTERCVLFKTEVKPNHTNLLLKGLSKGASHELLCLHAFTHKDPKEEYKEVSKKLAKYCEGHPLALEVLGKSLYNRNVDEWDDYIERLKKETDSRIEKVLRMSFDSLSSKNDKDLFKHIACFFVGKDRDFTEIILKACDINTRSGITNLTDRCLLSVGCNNELRMHQLLQDMGRDVVRQESPEKPWKRSRLWCHKEAFKVLKQKKGMENVLGLTLDMRMLGKENLRGSFEVTTHALSKMDNLMLLQLNYVKINGSYEDFPEDLRWLCMHGFSLNSIPSDLPMENLVVLDMSYSNIESFGMSSTNPQPLESRQKLIGLCSKEKLLLGSLKILDLSFCVRLRSLSGFSGLLALERLIVRNCISLIKICESIEQCVELLLIDLSYCYKLKKIPRSIGKLKKVKTLLLDGCNSDESQTGTRDMDSLQTQNTIISGISSQTSSSAMVEAIPSNSKFFTICLPSSLVSLSLAYNKLSNESFPTDLSGLSMLKDLCLDGNPIVSLPNCVRSLPRLEKLDMSNCEMLMSVEHPPCTLKKLIVLPDIFRPGNSRSLQKIVFDPEMSPIELQVDSNLLAPSSIEIEGIFKIELMACVDEKVLLSLGWSNLDITKKQRMMAHNLYLESHQIQMYYEFGIFSTFYGGKEMPSWINHRSMGASILFTIPSSPNQLRGLNICCVHKPRFPDLVFELLCDEPFPLPMIRITNITKNRTWIYKHCIQSLYADGECQIFLSHWMFGMTEMEGGDQVTVTVTEQYNQITRECGISLVYDDGSMEEEEDALGYYKSWTHIIGGDLSAFQLTSGTYILYNTRFCWDYYVPFANQSSYYPFKAEDASYVDVNFN